MEQNSAKQAAWFRSFIVWLVLEIVFVSSAVVFVTHFLIPSIVMKDVMKIKLKVLDTIREYKSSLNENESCLDDKKPFNAANYVFVSTRVAQRFPDLPESKIILKYSTPWPRQSYKQNNNITKSYSKKFSFLTSSASMILVYVIQGFLNIPPICQDTLMHVISTSGLGYLGVLLLKLYRIYPAIPFLIILVIGIIIHFTLHVKQRNEFETLSQISPKVDKKISTPSVKLNSIVPDLPNQVNAKLHEDMRASAPASAIVASPSRTKHVSRRASVKAGVNLVNDIRRLHAMNASITITENDIELGNECKDLSSEVDSRGDGSEDISDDSSDAGWLTAYVNNKTIQSENSDSYESSESSEESEIYDFITQSHISKNDEVINNAGDSSLCSDSDMSIHLNKLWDDSFMISDSDI
jgi:hypothetical protein